MNYPRIASMIFNTPHMCTPEIMTMAVRWANHQLNMGIAAPIGTLLQSTDTETESMEANGVRKTDHIARCQLSVTAGLAIIPISGILVSRVGHLDMCADMTAYEYLSRQVRAAINDDEVEHIVLDIDSGGGSATGCFEIAEEIFAMRGSKPITAIVNFSAYSAAYLIAAACDEIVVSMTSGVGSIGTIAEHLDVSKAQEGMGIKITTVYKGDNKNILSPNEPITEQSLQFLDRMTQEMYDQFVSAVARYRGLNVQDVVNTQAGIYRGQAALDAGLADRIASPNMAITEIAAAVKPKPLQVVGMDTGGRIGRAAAAMKMKQEISL